MEGRCCWGDVVVDMAGDVSSVSGVSGVQMLQLTSHAWAMVRLVRVGGLRVFGMNGSER